MTLSMIGSETLLGKSNEPLSITIFRVLRLESYSTRQARHWDKCSSSTIRRAQELLEKRSVGLIDVAAYCGFSSQSHLE